MLSPVPCCGFSGVSQGEKAEMLKSHTGFSCPPHSCLQLAQLVVVTLLGWENTQARANLGEGHESYVGESRGVTQAKAILGQMPAINSQTCGE